MATVPQQSNSTGDASLYGIAIWSTSGSLVVLFGWLYCSLRKSENGTFAKRLAGCMCLVNALLLAKFGLALTSKSCNDSTC